MVGSIAFEFDEVNRMFVLDPFGERATAVCRMIPKVEFRHRVRKFYLHELYWPELVRWCKKVGFTPQVVRNYAKRLRPEAVPMLDRTPTGILLREYQRIGAGVMCRPGGSLLGDDMGLGKTPQALVAYSHLRKAGECVGMVVVGPSAVMGQWGEEAEKFLGESAFVVKDPGDVIAMPDSGIVCMTYAKTFRDPYQRALLALMRSKKWILCMDEIHRSGSDGTQQHLALAAASTGPKYKWGLTGTAIPNDPPSFLPAYRLLTGSQITSEEFSSYFRRPNGDWSLDKLESVQKVRAQFGLRRCKSEVLKELPPLTELVHEVEMTPQQKSMRETLFSGGHLKKLDETGIEEIIENKGILGEMIRDLQVASHPLLLGGDDTPTNKWPLLKEIVENRGGEQVIVWSYHPDTIEWICRMLEGLGVKSSYVHGKVGAEKRDEIRKAFIAGEFPVLVANPMSYAEGVNLQNASIMAYWDESYSKHLWEQSRARSYRMGQTLPVTIHYLLTAGTVETRCHEYVRTKKELADAMEGAAEHV